MEEITIRDLIPSEDSAFILDSWLRSYYGKSFFTQQIPISIFKKNHARIVHNILGRPGALKIAVKRDDPNIIAGYIAFEKEKNTLHYVYVKESFRGFGICHHLLKTHNLFDGTIITHMTLKGKKIQLRMGYLYSPYFD